MQALMPWEKQHANKLLLFFFVLGVSFSYVLVVSIVDSCAVAAVVYSAEWICRSQCPVLAGIMHSGWGSSCRLQPCSKGS
jgi:hypothetical protein